MYPAGRLASDDRRLCTLAHRRHPRNFPLPCSNIACNCEQAQKQMVAEGALHVLADLLPPDSGASGACREAAAWALSNLACCADVRAQLA